MKITTLTNKRTEQRYTSAFTLIEMIGVLAVIAILAALLLPKVFSAINEARVSNTSVSIESLKTALADHYGKYNALNVSNTTSLTIPAAGYPNFDGVLMGEGLLDKPFATKIGTSATVQLIGGTAANGGSGYNLGQGNTTASQTYTAEVVIPGVVGQDAADLSAQIDGATMSTNVGLTDISGRVEYVAPAAGATTTVYIYITGR